MRGRILENWVIDFAKRQVVTNEHLLGLVHSVSMLSYLQLEECLGDHIALIFNASLSD